MVYIVNSQPGDCLCSIARREGFSNCGTLRSQAANAGILDQVLAPGTPVTIPQAWNTYFYAGLATGRRYTIRWLAPIPVPQPTNVRIVRTVATPPANADAIADIGISRYITRSTDFQGDDSWVDHTHYAHDAPSVADPNTFNIDVDDPNHVGQSVEVYLEAMMPLYAHGALAGHQRFPAGAERNARSLTVTCYSVNGTARHRSSYLRLVVDQYDKAARPRQTLLVTDAVAAGAPEVEILDQNIHARYEYAGCPRAAGERCLLSERTIPLRRGRSVELRMRILRANRSGVVGTVANGLGDDGVILRQTALDRIHTHLRRIWAQEEIAFELDRLETVDPPSDMLTFGDATGDPSSGTNAAADAPGRVGFTIDLNTIGADVASYVVGPLDVPAGQTPLATAQQVRQAINGLHIGGLNCPAPVANPAIDGHAGRSADLRLSFGPGFVTLRGLTAPPDQDSAQPVEHVAVNINALAIRSGINNAYAGGSMQRALYGAFNNQPQGINVFVVQSLGGGAPPMAHTLNSQHVLGAAYRSLPAVENCIVIGWESMQPNLALKPATLAHEIGHALIDNAEHSTDDDAEGSLMNAATSQNFGGTYDTKRIISWPVCWYVITETAHAVPPIIMGGALPLCMTAPQRSMHGMIAANGRIVFTPR